LTSSRAHLFLSLFLIGIVLCLGWLTHRFESHLDLTANARHSLSATTEKVLNNLADPLEIIAVTGPDRTQREAITSLIDRIKDIKPDTELVFLNPDTDPAAIRELNASAGGELILRSGGRETRLKNLAERQLSNSLRQLNRQQDRKISFITGHEERSPTTLANDGWKTVADRLSAIGLVSREHSLVSEPTISLDIDLVVIAAPRRPYFPGEIASLNNYMNQGGNLLWLIEPYRESAAQNNLNYLSEYLGVEAVPGTVIDTASQGLVADSADFVVLNRFPVHPVTAILNSPILLPQVAALAVTPLAGQTALPLLQTEESSWTETGALAGAIAFDENSSEVAGPLLLGVSIERRLAQGTQRFAIIGDADFASSQFIDNGGNQAFTEALLLWLTGDSETLEFITQPAQDATLELDNRSIIVLSGLYLAVIPFVFLVLAILVRWIRGRA